jgi:hypothetical protein
VISDIVDAILYLEQAGFVTWGNPACHGGQIAVTEPAAASALRR